MRITCILGLIGSAALLMAADPSTGTWKLNQDQSKFSEGAAPKEETIVIEDLGDKLHVSITGIEEDGTPISIAYIVPVSGGEGKMEDASYEGVSGKSVGSNTRETTYSKNGKKMKTKMATSSDGKTMTVDVDGHDSKGKAKKGKMTFDKQ